VVKDLFYSAERMDELADIVQQLAAQAAHGEVEARAFRDATGQLLGPIANPRDLLAEAMRQYGLRPEEADDILKRLGDDPCATTGSS
jgi:hypothetical protein